MREPRNDRKYEYFITVQRTFVPCSETQGQIVGARESLNGRGNMAWRKVKNGVKSPWGQCLTRPVPNGRPRSAFWLGRKTQKFSGTNQKPERPRQFETGLVRHCPQGLFSSLLLFFVPYFHARLDFLSPPLSAPGSPRMLLCIQCQLCRMKTNVTDHHPLLTLHWSGCLDSRLPKPPFHDLQH